MHCILSEVFLSEVILAICTRGVGWSLFEQLWTGHWSGKKNSVSLRKLMVHAITPIQKKRFGFVLSLQYGLCGCVWKCCVPLNPMVLLIIIPIKIYEQLLFHWEYTLFFRQTHVPSDSISQGDPAGWTPSALYIPIRNVGWCPVLFLLSVDTVWQENVPQFGIAKCWFMTTRSRNYDGLWMFMVGL